MRSVILSLEKRKLWICFYDIVAPVRGYQFCSVRVTTKYSISIYQEDNINSLLEIVPANVQHVVNIEHRPCSV